MSRWKQNRSVDDLMGHLIAMNSLIEADGGRVFLIGEAWDCRRFGSGKFREIRSFMERGGRRKRRWRAWGREASD
jgi:hypothetical protein